MTFCNSASLCQRSSHLSLHQRWFCHKVSTPHFFGKICLSNVSPRILVSIPHFFSLQNLSSKCFTRNDFMADLVFSMYYDNLSRWANKNDMFEIEIYSWSFNFLWEHNCKTPPFHLSEADCSIFTLSVDVVLIDVSVDFAPMGVGTPKATRGSS